MLVQALSSEEICSLLGIGRGDQDVGESTNVFVRFLYYLLIVAYVFVNYILLFIAWPPPTPSYPSVNASSSQGQEMAPECPSLHAPPHLTVL